MAKQGARGIKLACVLKEFIQRALVCWLILCVNLTQARVIREEEAQLRECLHDIQAKGVFSTTDQWETAQPTVGGAIPGLVVPGSVRTQAEQAMGSTQ